MTLPMQLSVNPKSPHYDFAACKRVDKVFVNEKHLPNVYAYDIEAGWAAQMINGVWKPKVYGTVRVTEKG